ncbi:F-box only protein 22 [Xenopus laevis]|uniref:F-box only protein 22 n=2 Tax=Xenopus laevis TaxID=8355 RepID=A0A1L8GZS7_XENLA|nr:F-box only protein 22 [Xenopus laevis]OCT89347.1 hypothetical protein XELAEV_18017967mg [Xenopus laevis]
MAGAELGNLKEYENRGLRNLGSLEVPGHCVLSSLAEVVERILSFLPCKDLLRSACVCRLWRDCARRKMKARQRMTWISCSGSCVSSQQPSSHSLLQVVREELEKMYILPDTVLYINQTEIYSGHNRRGPTKAKRKQEMLAAAAELEKLLPQDCQILGFATPGVVVTPMGSAGNRPLELEDEEAGFAFILPRINGVKIQKFSSFRGNGFDESQLQETGLKNNPDLRFVLVFGCNTWKDGGDCFLQEVLNPLNERSIIIAGGQVEHLLSFSPKSNVQVSRCIGVVGLAFYGPQIQGASVLLESNVYDEKTVDSTIHRLKAANIPEENSVGFMFACVARGEQYYKKKNVEADSFRKHFPNVPLLGFFGNGEIGCDRVVSNNFILRECNGKKDNLLHGYTTVMAIIHFGSTK